MREILQSFVRFFVSLRLTVVLLVFSILLVFLATLDQVHLGVWGIQHKWFFTFIVVQSVNGFPVPVFPGGYFIGGMLLINLVAAHVYRFKLTWKKSGIWLAHLGLILLIASQFFSGLQQRESQMRLSVGETKRYSEDFRLNELAVIDTTDPKLDDVVSIPESLLARDEPIQHPKLPFRIVTRLYYPNSVVQMRSQAPDAPPSPATMGIGAQAAVTPQPITYKENDTNFPAACVELIGQEGSLGIWLVSPWIDRPQSFDYAGRTWQLVMRFRRYYTPYQITLLKFSHDRYPGTDTPKNFSSQVRIHDEAKGDRDVLIYMNNPLRYSGLTFYQAGFEPDDKATILQVVRNPSWLMPYIACLLVAAGLVIQFGLHLFSFVRQRSAAMAK